MAPEHLIYFQRPVFISQLMFLGKSVSPEFMRCSPKGARGSLLSNKMWATGLHNIVHVSFLYYFHELLTYRRIWPENVTKRFHSSSHGTSVQRNNWADMLLIGSHLKALNVFLYFIAMKTYRMPSLRSAKESEFWNFELGQDKRRKILAWQLEQWWKARTWKQSAKNVT